MAITPNMLLNLPDPTVTPGPEWAQALNEALATIDNHDHTSDNGVQVPISAVDINQNLDMDKLEIVDTKALNFQNLALSLPGVSNINKLHVVNGNVWFTNAGGIPVQITDGNAIINTIVVPASPLMPSGAMLDFAGGVVPVGFLLCDGSAVSRVTYSDLFAVLGTSWGVGNGTTTFNIPNTSGRASVGAGTYTDTVSGSVTRSVGQSLGAEAHVLTIPQLPSHNHTQNPHNHASNWVQGGGGAGSGSTYNFATQALTTSTTATNNPTGGDLAHNNMQPSFVVLKMIKT